MNRTQTIKQHPELMDYTEKQLDLLFDLADRGEQKHQDYIDGKHNQPENSGN